jgi:hypothetical protein
MSESDPEATPLSPIGVLFSYWAERLALHTIATAEAQAAQAAGRDMKLEDLRTRMSAIRDRHCTQRKRRNDCVVAYGPLEASANDPSNFVVEREEQESAKRAVIYTFNTALREHWRYTLVFQKGQWLIDSMQFQERSWKRKWEWVSGTL